MRVNGTIYPVIDKLPANAMPVSVYAREHEMQVGHVYMKYKRYYTTKESKAKPDYVIRCFMGANFIIPE